MTTLSDFVNAPGRRRLLVVSVAALILSACGGGLLGPSQEPPKIYVLQPQLRALDDAPARTWQLAIAQPDAAQTFQTARIALQRGQTMDYYADVEWTDSTPHLLQSLLVQAFETSGRIRGVAPESAGVHADYVLETEIRSFEARYQGDNGPPTAVVSVVARLVSAGRGEVVGTFQVSHEAQAAQNSVPAAVEAFDQATSQTLEDIAGWTLKTAPQNGALSAGARRSP
jgi:cholesterol transport system auxiliary component